MFDGKKSAYVINEWSHRKTSPSLPNLATAKEVTKKTEIKRKAFSRLVDFLEHYGEKVLDKLLPEVAMKAGMDIVFEHRQLLAGSVFSKSGLFRLSFT